MANRLGWHIGDNLRWLADNKGADYLPCGMLHGSFLVQVADGYENLVAENRLLTAAQGIAAGTDETLKAAQPEGQEPGSRQRMRPTLIGLPGCGR